MKNSNLNSVLDQTYRKKIENVVTSFREKSIRLLTCKYSEWGNNKEHLSGKLLVVRLTNFPVLHPVDTFAKT